VIAAAGTATYPWVPLVMVLPAAIIYISLKRSLQLAEQTIHAVERMADVVDRRDPYTYQHSIRVAQYSVQIGRRLGLNPDQVRVLGLAARVHDLGKVGVPDAVLLKPGQLTPEEWAEMERHPQIGCEILTEFAEYGWPKGRNEPRLVDAVDQGFEISQLILPLWRDSIPRLDSRRHPSG